MLIYCHYVSGMLSPFLSSNQGMHSSSIATKGEVKRKRGTFRKE